MRMEIDNRFDELPLEILAEIAFWTARREFGNNVLAFSLCSRRCNAAANIAKVFFFFFLNLMRCFRFVIGVAREISCCQWIEGVSLFSLCTAVEDSRISRFDVLCS